MRIFHPVQYSQRKFLPRSKSERGHKLCTSATFQNYCQSACVSTDNTVVHRFIRWRERDREVCGESRSSGHSTRLRKNQQCLRGTATSSYYQSPLQSWHTQQRHSMSEEALFEHSHKGTRPYYQSESSPIPGKLTTPSRTAVSCSGWHCSSLRKTVLDYFPRGVVIMSLSLNRQQHLNWRHIRNQPSIFSFSSVVTVFLFLAMKYWIKLDRYLSPSFICSK